MAVTRNELKVLTLARLDERYGSTAAALYDATNSSAVLQTNATTWAVVTSGGVERTTDNELDKYLNLAQDEIASTCIYIEGSATLTWPTTAYSCRLQDLTNASNQGDLIGVEQVTKTVSNVTTTLLQMKRSALRTQYPEYRTTSAAPLYWAIEQDVISLQAKPSANTAMAFYGPCLPMPLGSGSGGTTATSAGWMHDSDLRRAIPTVAAILMARRKFNDSNLFGRMEEMTADYGDWYARKRAMLSLETLDQHFRAMAPDLQPVKR